VSGSAERRWGGFPGPLRFSGEAGGIGCMDYEIMVSNCSENKLNSGKIAATLSRAGQII
jgi:hypothetical protein